MDHLQNVMGYFDQQQPLCAEHDRIAKDLYREFGVKAGLRDENGKGVLAGLTNISDIRAFQYVNGVKKPADGQLLYRGYDVKDLIRGSSGSRFAFEEAAYLLLFGELPTQEKLEEFCRVLGECRTMPTNFTRDVIMKAPSHDIMNSMARSVLTLASYDPMANDLDISNVLRQSIQLTGIFPMLAVYGYHAYNHYEKDGSMYIHRPDPQLSTAENFLRMLRPDMKYTELEAQPQNVSYALEDCVYELGEGEVLILGDNTYNSTDGRWLQRDKNGNLRSHLKRAYRPEDICGVVPGWAVNCRRFSTKCYSFTNKISALFKKS